MVRILNPLPASVVVYQDEDVGVLCPLEDPDEVCTMTLQKGQEDHRQRDSKKLDKPSLS